MPVHSGWLCASRNTSLLASVMASPQLLLRRPGLAVEPGPDLAKRGFRRPFAGRLAPHAVDDHEQATLRVAVVAVFVVLAPQAGVAGSGGREWRAVRGGLLISTGTPGFEVQHDHVRQADPRARGQGHLDRPCRASDPPRPPRSTGRARRPPSVPRLLRSFRKNWPDASSRLRRRCSRDTSGEVSSFTSTQ